MLTQWLFCCGCCLMFSFPEDNSQALYPSCPGSLDSSEPQMREERFRAFIKPQTAPALTSYKSQHGSQPNVNPLHPPLILCGSVLHASELKHSVVAKEGVGVKEKWKRRLRWRWEMKRLKAGFATGQWTPMMWERMCGLFPVTKAISPWKDFRDWCYLI